MKRDDWDERASSLFDAGRREAPDASAKRRTLEQALARVEQRRTRPIAPFAWAALAAAVLGAFWLLPQREETHAPISAEQPRSRESAAPSQPAESASVPEPLAPAATAPKSLATRERSPDAGSARRKPASKPASPPPPTLEAELAVLDRARTELAAGQTDAALASLDHYATLRGTHLALEARLLRVQALAAKGDRARAAALARELVAQHPNSPLAERARRFTTLDIERDNTPTGEGQ